jgi:hypothetical protein
MKSSQSKVLFGAFLYLFFAIGFASPAQADSTYTYTGNPYTVCNGNYSPCSNYEVTGSFTVSTPLGADLNNQAITPTSFSFTDGSLTLTQSNTTSSYFDMSTDGSGNISGWSLGAVLNNIFYYGYEVGSNDSIYTSFNGTTGEDDSQQNYYYTYQSTYICGEYEYGFFQYGYNYCTGTYQGSSLGGGSNTNTAGFWTNPPAESDYVPASTPEPSSLVMLASGLLGLAGWRRKRLVASSSLV